MLGRIILLSAFLLVSLPSMSQVGHPAKGSWSGSMGPNAADSSRIRLLINAEDGALSGVINPGRRGVDATSVELNSSNWTLTVRANMPDGELVLMGKLENLGSWTNRKYMGTYTLGNERGTFSINLN
jgi:hypothetical protein